MLLPLGLLIARRLAFAVRRGRALYEALIALPLVLPPTVLGYYLLRGLGAGSPVGRVWQETTGHGLAFSFDGILLASIVVNLPFAVQPMQRALEALPTDVRAAAWVSGLSPWRTFWRIELPLAWPGVLSALVLTFAHTMGEFGVVLMVGGNIEGATRTASMAIYDRSQTLDPGSAGPMAALLLAVSLIAIALVNVVARGVGRRV